MRKTGGEGNSLDAKESRSKSKKGKWMVGSERGGAGLKAENTEIGTSEKKDLTFLHPGLRGP